MSKGRVEKSLRNSTLSLTAQIVSVALSFVVRTIFIKHLGNSYLGIDGLFTNILSLLSFAELGFGTAIVYAMYKPLADNDEKQISAFMNFYAKIYRSIGGFILIGGACLIPFLDFFIGDKSQIPADLPPLYIVYMLYILNTAAGYFFNYKRSIVLASQNGYIDSLNQLAFNTLRNILQIFVLIIFHSFILYLLIQIVCTFLGNIFISLKADKLFPFLKLGKREKLDNLTIRSILKNVSAMTFHKLGSVVVGGTDSILITKFVSLVATGQYSNYVLLTSTVKNVYLQILSPLTASVGNLIATESKEKSYAFFKRILFMNSYIAIFCTVCLTYLSNPFIELFWGKDSMFSMSLVLLIMTNFYINSIRKTAQMFIDTTGLFWQIRWKSLVEAIINLGASIFFASTLNMGITGIVLGTIVSNVTTNVWWEPYVVYKFFFEKPLYLYFVDYSKNLICLILSFIVSYKLIMLTGSGISGFALKCIISALIPNIVIFLLFSRTDEYKYFVNLLTNVIRKRVIKSN
ncbi:lipopolysaccharide biosynthesis protein [Neobacillus sp. KR4-4]|uniref:lipopolysaccharide biosynthesis protein n=1 Tax=Neobacillus sp. KR4-4 TaxID=3344872 RepID=UPI0035CC71C0